MKYTSAIVITLVCLICLDVNLARTVKRKEGNESSNHKENTVHHKKKNNSKNEKQATTTPAATPAKPADGTATTTPAKPADSGKTAKPATTKPADGTTTTTPADSGKPATTSTKPADGSKPADGAKDDDKLKCFYDENIETCSDKKPAKFSKGLSKARCYFDSYFKVCREVYCLRNQGKCIKGEGYDYLKYPGCSWSSGCIFSNETKECEPVNCSYNTQTYECARYVGKIPATDKNLIVSSSATDTNTPPGPCSLDLVSNQCYLNSCQSDNAGNSCSFDSFFNSWNYSFNPFNNCKFVKSRGVCVLLK